MTNINYINKKISQNQKYNEKAHLILKELLNISNTQNGGFAAHNRTALQEQQIISELKRHLNKKLFDNINSDLFQLNNTLTVLQIDKKLYNYEKDFYDIDKKLNNIYDKLNKINILKK